MGNPAMNAAQAQDELFRQRTELVRRLPRVWHLDGWSVNWNGGGLGMWTIQLVRRRGEDDLVLTVECADPAIVDAAMLRAVHRWPRGWVLSVERHRPRNFQTIRSLKREGAA